MGTTARLWMTAILVAMIYGGVHVIHQAQTRVEVRPPKRDLSDLPTRLGSWIAEKPIPNPETFPDAGAETTVTQMYQNPAGEMASVYTAVWLKYDILTPHPPELCYGGAGYRILTEDKVQLQVAGQSNTAVRLMWLEREGRRVCVLYWYQLGDRIVFDTNEQRRVVWTLRGEKSWPPLVKVMIEVPATDPEKAEALLRSIAVPLFEWTNQLH